MTSAERFRVQFTELVFGSRPPTLREKEQPIGPRPFAGLPAEAHSLPPTP
jgi:hypothetical protein